jgi:pectinesterase
MILMQDTLYLHYGKQYLKDCYIEGSVDFIFGNSTALLEHCHIHCKSAGFITAQGRKSSQETTGYVFLRYLLDQSFTISSSVKHLGFLPKYFELISYIWGIMMWSSFL